MTHQTTAAPAAQLLRLPAVKQLLGLSKSSLYRLVKAGEFPAPVQLTARTVAWRAADVGAWVSSRTSTRKEG